MKANKNLRIQLNKERGKVAQLELQIQKLQKSTKSGLQNLKHYTGQQKPQSHIYTQQDTSKSDSDDKSEYDQVIKQLKTQIERVR